MSSYDASTLTWLLGRATDECDLPDFVTSLLEHLLAATGARVAALLLQEGPVAGHLYHSAPNNPTATELDGIRARLDTRVEDRDQSSLVLPFRLRATSGSLLLDGLDADLADDAEAAVTAALPVLELVVALAVAREEASHDPLTGLANRRLLAERLGAAIEEGNRYGRTFALALLDMNNFKWFNDTYGHSEGDQLLRTFGSVLRSRVRRADVVVRYGGDEFLLLLPHTDASDARTLLARVETELERFLDRYESAGMRLGFSYGLSHYPTDGRDPDTLIRHADERLYDAKVQAGLNAR